jgi:hypothetical protein
MLLLMIFLSEKSKGLSRNGGFSFEKRQFSEASRSKADFDPRPTPMENMDLLLAVGLPTFEIRNKGHYKGLAPWLRAPLRPTLHQSYRFFYNP